MRKIFIYLSLLFLSSHTPRVEDLPPHPSYFKHYYSQLNHWLNKNIFPFEANTPESPAREINETISQARHWYTQGNSNKIPTLLWGVGYNIHDGLLKYSIHWQRGNKLKSISFPQKEICQHDFDQKSLTCPPLAPTKTFKSKDFIFPEFPLTKDGQFIFSQFVTDHWMYKEQGKPSYAFFHLRDIQSDWLPKKLLEIVNQIGHGTRLPLDKISISAEGDVFAYYP